MEAALIYRRAEVMSDRDPEGWLPARLELDLLLAAWEQLTRPAQPTPKETVAAVVKNLGAQHGPLKNLLSTDEGPGIS